MLVSAYISSLFVQLAITTMFTYFRPLRATLRQFLLLRKKPLHSSYTWLKTTRTGLTTNTWIPHRNFQWYLWAGRGVLFIRTFLFRIKPEADRMGARGNQILSISCSSSYVRATENCCLKLVGSPHVYGEQPNFGSGMGWSTRTNTHKDVSETKIAPQWNA